MLCVRECLWRNLGNQSCYLLKFDRDTFVTAFVQAFDDRCCVLAWDEFMTEPIFTPAGYEFVEDSVER